MSVERVTAEPYSIWVPRKLPRIPPPNPGLPVAINLPFQLFGKSMAMLKEVLSEDCTRMDKAQMGRASLVTFQGMLILTSGACIVPKLVTEDVKVTVALLGRSDEKLSAEQFRVADVAMD